jgi:hypothetical protein
VVDADGYVKPRRTARPLPRPATINEFIHTNTFEKLSQKERKTKRREDAWRIAMMEEDEEDDVGDIEIVPEVPSDVQAPAPRTAAATLYSPSCCHSCSIPGLHRPFTKDETADLYQQVRTEVMEDTQTLGVVSLLEHEQPENVILATLPEEVTVLAAADTGAAACCLHPDDLPRGAVPCGNKDDKHFTGAGGEHIENYGKCDVMLNGKLLLATNVCEVTRSLHSISQIAGPEDGPGVHDVILDRKSVV